MRQHNTNVVVFTVAVLCVLATLALLCRPAAALYLPRVKPVAYQRNELVPLYVNKIDSTQTQLAYDYYSLPFCAPENIEEESEYLGDVLAGDLMRSSLYELHTRTNEYCKVLCRAVYTKEQGAAFAEKIRDKYSVDWALDNLPAAVRLYSETDVNEVYYEREFPLGFSDPTSDTQYLYNHIRFTIKYNPNVDRPGARIVGFEMEPFSVRHTYESDWGDNTELETCNNAVRVARDMASQRIDQGGEVIFTYDVNWQVSGQPWSTRWELYNKIINSDEEFH